MYNCTLHKVDSIYFWFPEEFIAYIFFLNKNCIEQYFSVHCAVNEETWVDCWGAKDQWQGTSYFAKYEPSFEPFRSWCISPQTPHGVKDFTNVIATLDPEAPRRCFLLKDKLKVFSLYSGTGISSSVSCKPIPFLSEWWLPATMTLWSSLRDS